MIRWFTLVTSLQLLKNNNHHGVLSGSGEIATRWPVHGNEKVGDHRPSRYLNYLVRTKSCTVNTYQKNWFASNIAKQITTRGMRNDLIPGRLRTLLVMSFAFGERRSTASSAGQKYLFWTKKFFGAEQQTFKHEASKNLNLGLLQMCKSSIQILPNTERIVIQITKWNTEALSNAKRVPVSTI